MAINVDLSKPLTEKQIAELRTLLPEGQVQRYIDLAGMGDGDEGDDGLYDPGKHTVDEVKEHVLTADEDEVARVIEAEKSGKNRTTLIEALESE
jgi:hypothetical protein